MTHDPVPARELARDPRRPAPGNGKPRPGVPGDLRDDAVRRLGPAALLIAASIALFIGGYRVTVGQALSGTDAAVLALLAALTGALFLLARKRPLGPERMLDLGLAYQVVVALLLGLLSNQSAMPHLRTGPVLSPITAVILVFPLLVPASVWKVAAAGVASAAMDVFSLMIVDPDLAGSLSVREMLVRFMPNLLSVGFAVGAVKALHHLGRQVETARRLGNYRLVRLLGRGGMGEVWEARHRMLARPAAIKLIPGDVLRGSTPEELEIQHRRLEREARATASLQSPHTIVTYDFGTARDGSFFYVMELLDGTDLESLVREFGPVPAERAVHFLQQIALSLAEAHENRFIHRDIKPANVFACRYGSEVDFVKVLDFGLVKPLDLETGEAGNLTRDDVVAGTPAFMAPELIRSSGPVDGRADLYALGCVAWWLLTGRLVFDRPTAMDMILAHLHEEPRPPSSHTECHIPRELETLILDLLQKDPGRRPRSARDVIERLAAIPVEQPWSRDRARRWWESHLPRRRPESAAEKTGEPVRELQRASRD